MSKAKTRVALVVLVLLAAGCAPPSQNEARGNFVYLGEHIPGIVLDVRYHSSDNFMGTPVDGYERPVILVSEPAAAALAEVQAQLNKRGLGLKVFDAYRPQKAVDHFVRWAADSGDTTMKNRYYPDVPKNRLFELGYIAERSGHTRGSTVDLTIVNLESGEELDMGSPWDFFGEISHHDSPLVDEEATANRELLRGVMVEHGFEPYANEWWHYTLADEPYPDTYFDFDVK
ncbi:MAG: M15 family metallopeptidase [Woeseiaceae bacterium]|nr:M15 family metallopeptidase [Woeseiaceae bacterium]